MFEQKAVKIIRIVTDYFSLNYFESVLELPILLFILSVYFHEHFLKSTKHPILFEIIKKDLERKTFPKL